MIDRDTVIALAAKHATCIRSQHKEFLHDGLVAFVSEISQMAAETEREACARINADKSDRLAQEAEQADREGDRDTCTSNRAAAHLLSVCAARIRARGTGGEEPGKDVCSWYSGNYGGWHSSCGTAYVFESGGPFENGHKFCHCCGKPLIVKDAKDTNDNP